MSSFGRQLVTLGLLVICALAGALGVLRATSGEMGFSPDSVSYYTMAEGIVAGKGFVDVRRYDTPVKPIYPPAYSSLLAAGGLLSSDLMGSIRWLHALLLAMSAAVVGWGLYRGSGSRVVMVLGCALFIGSGDMIFLHGKVWSETFFVLLTLGCVLALASYLESGGRRILLAAAACAALAVMVRYPGVAALAGGCLVVFARRAPWRQRFGDTLIFGLAGSSLLLPWLARNWWVFGRPYLGSSRSPSTYAFRAENLIRGVDTMAAWAGSPTGLYLLLMALAFWALTPRLNERSDRASNTDGFRASLLFSCLAFIFPYSAVMLAGTYKYGLNKPFDARALAPIFGPLLWIVVLTALGLLGRVATRLPRGQVGQRVRDVVGLCAATLLLALTTHEGFKASDPARITGIFQGPKRAVVEAVKGADLQDPVFTNIDDTLYMLTWQQCLRLPQTYHVAGRHLPLPDSEERWAEFREQLKDGGTIVYYAPSRRRYLPSEEELVSRLPLEVQHAAADGTIYRVKPTP